MPTKPESTTSSKISSTGSIERHSVLPFADVVGQQRHPVAAAPDLAHQLDHRLVRLQGLEVDLAEAVHLGPVAELGLERRADPLEEVGLGHPPGLERVQRMVAVALGDRLHRPAERLGGDPGAILKRRERVHQRRRQHAAEVRDHGLDRRVPHAGRRMSSAPAPAAPADAQGQRGGRPAQRRRRRARSRRSRRPRPGSASRPRTGRARARPAAAARRARTRSRAASRRAARTTRRRRARRRPAPRRGRRRPPGAARRPRSAARRRAAPESTRTASTSSQSSSPARRQTGRSRDGSRARGRRARPSAHSKRRRSAAGRLELERDDLTHAAHRARSPGARSTSCAVPS